MRNQIMSDLLYHSLFEEEIKMEEELEDELEHHGVKDMSWGERNGPPYPLRGIDKKIARAQYRKEREQKKRLKKLQKAAKKARKLKKKEERTQEQIRKKKQQLVKKGNMEEIRKNADLFTNEELEYIVDRDNKKRSLKSNQERDKDEKIELFMKRFGQFASIASDSQKVLTAVKMGAEIVSQVKANKVKDIEAEQKQWDRYSKEFDARNKLDPEDAKGYLEFITGGASYRPKDSRKQIQNQSQDTPQIGFEDRGNTKDKGGGLFGKKKDKGAKPQDVKTIMDKTAGALEMKELKQDVYENGKAFLLDESDNWKAKRAQSKLQKIDKKIWNTAYENIYSQNDAKRQYADVQDSWTPKQKEVKASYDSGKDWIASFLSSDWKGSTYETQKGFQVTPQKNVNFSQASEPASVSEAKNTSKYTLSDRNRWFSKPIASVANDPSNSIGKKYTLSDRNKWSSKPVTALVNSMETRTKNNAIHFISESNLQKPKIQIGSISPDRARARDLAYQSRNYEKALSDILPKTWHAPAPKRYSYQYIPPERMAELRSLAGDMSYYDMVAKNSHKTYGDVVPNSVHRKSMSLSPKEMTFVKNLLRKSGSW